MDVLLFHAHQQLAHMNSFENVPLSEGKRPILFEGEIELIIQDDVSIYEGHEYLI